MKKQILLTLIPFLMLGTGSCSCSKKTSSGSDTSTDGYSSVAESDKTAVYGYLASGLKNVVGQGNHGFNYLPHAHLTTDDDISDFGLSYYKYPEEGAATAPARQALSGHMKSAQWKFNGLDQLTDAKYLSNISAEKLTIESEEGEDAGGAAVTNQSPVMYGDKTNVYYDLTRAAMTGTAIGTAVSNESGTTWTMPGKSYRVRGSGETTVLESLFSDSELPTDRLMDHAQALVTWMQERETYAKNHNHTDPVALDKNIDGSYRLTFTPSNVETALFINGRIDGTSLDFLTRKNLKSDVNNYFSIEGLEWNCTLIYYFTADTFTSTDFTISAKAPSDKLVKSDFIAYLNSLSDIVSLNVTLPDLRLESFKVAGTLTPIVGTNAAVTLPDDIASYEKIVLPTKS